MLWESECQHTQISLANFNNWIQGKTGEDNPLTSFDKGLNSCYIDYKYMSDTFEKYPDVLKVIALHY